MIDKSPIERIAVKGSNLARSMGIKSRSRDGLLNCFGDIYNICRDSIQSDDFAELRRILAVCKRLRLLLRSSSFYKSDKVNIGQMVRNIEKVCISHLQLTHKIPSLSALDRPFRKMNETIRG